MLNDAQIDQWKDEGYCLAPGFFNADEARALQAEVQRLHDEGLMRNVSTAGDGKTEDRSQINFQLMNPMQISPLLRALPFADKMKNSVAALVGTPNELQTNQIFLKPGGNGSGTNWHQDNAYFGALDPTMGTGIWIAIHDANATNGTMRIIPNSHKTKLEHGRDLHSNHHIRCYPDEDKAITCTLPAGGVLFFNYGIAHCTGPNNTDRDRAGLAYHVHHCEIEAGPGQIKNRRDSDKGSAATRVSGGDDGASTYGESQNGAFDRLVGQGAG